MINSELSNMYGRKLAKLVLSFIMTKNFWYPSHQNY